jgi:hypothetical protein
MIRAKPGYTILASTVLQSATKNEFQATPDKKGGPVQITFDHLGHNEGGVIEILHTGTTGYALEFVGSIKGVGSAQEVRVKFLPFLSDTVRDSLSRNSPRDIRRFNFYANLILLIVIAIQIVHMLFFPTFINTTFGGMSTERAEVLSADRSGTILVVYFFIIGFLTWIQVNRDRRLVPSSLDKFDDN